MKTIYRIARTELQTLFYSPIAWLIIIIFTFQVAMSFSNMAMGIATRQEAGYAVGALTTSLFANGFSSIFAIVTGHLYLYIPLLTMSLMSRELSSGSIKLLYSSPITNTQIILGKFLSMMFIGLILIGVLLFFVLFSGVRIEHFDYPAAFSGLLGLYLLICTYAAVGLFMSSLTSYQVVAALLTLLTLTALNWVKGVGQEYEFVREITYWLAISGRIGEFINGLICSEDLLYYIIVSAFFLSLAIIRLESCRQKTYWVITFARYLCAVILTCGLGYLSSRPKLMTYYDATATKSNTLTEHSQEVVAKLKGGLTITTYVNALDINMLHTALPRNVKSDQERFRQYVRFKPEIEMEYVYYYDTIVSEALDKRYPNLNTKQRAQKIFETWRVDSTIFISSEEIRSQIDLFPEGNRFVRQLKRESGEETFLRVYNDMQRFPSEREITAAFKRIVMTLPKVGFLTGHGERSIERIGDWDYSTFAQEKTFRHALINQGFDVEKVTLEQEIPADIKILVIAEPRNRFSAEHQANLDKYIARGGNLIIGTSSRRAEIMNPLFAQFGVEQIPGTLVNVSEKFTPDVMIATPTKECRALNHTFEMMGRTKRVIVATRTAGFKYSNDKGYKVSPLFVTDSLAWNELETTNFVDDTVFLNPAIGEVQGQYVTSLALERQIAGKQQKIIILGDADYISNGELSRNRRGVRANNFALITGGFYWLSDEEVPINITRPYSKDRKMDISVKAMSIWKIIMMWGIPGLLIVISSIIWARRRGR